MSKNNRISQTEKRFIIEAAHYLENPSFVIKLTNIIGLPMEQGIELLPGKAQQIIGVATQKALHSALEVAIGSIEATTGGGFEVGQEKSRSTDLRHKLLTTVTGAAGGLFGLASLPIELPVTTTIMLRGIAGIAQDYGHDIRQVDIRLDCLSVFAMGSPSSLDDAVDSAYFASRVAMARAANEAAKWVAGKTAQEIAEGIASKSAPPLVRMIAKVAARFNIVVTESAVAKAVPGIAIAAGALINTAFSDHFFAVARYHFGIRALEARYGADAVREIYQANIREV